MSVILSFAALSPLRRWRRYNLVVIKTAIIFVLLILLAGGAFLSRPTKQGFEQFLREQSERKDNPIARWIAGIKLDKYIESSTFKDRLLWVEVENEGKTQFIGVFSRFFSVSAGEHAAAAAKEDVWNKAKSTMLRGN